MDENGNERKRRKRRVKLSVGQRKNLVQHSHSMHRKTKDKLAPKSNKRKLEDDHDQQEEIPTKIHVQDVSDIVDSIADEEQIPEFASGEEANSFSVHEDAEEAPAENEAGNAGQNQMNFPQHLYYALQALQDEDVLKPLLIELDSIEAVDDYILQARLLANGKLPVNNLPFLLSLERAKFAHVTTTTLMRFRPETKAFFRVGYRTWHGKGMLLLSGSKNRGQVRSHYTKRGYYDPADASVNFAVPDVKTLFGKQCGIPKFIHPGIVEESFDLIKKDKQYVLSYDLKKVTRGFKKDQGDEDMWNFEGPPTLEDSLRRIENEKKKVEDLTRFSKEKNLPGVAAKCKELLHVISLRLKEV